MYEYVFPYLLSSLITLSVLLTSIWTLLAMRRRGLDLDELEQRIPDAARLDNLELRRAEAEQQWDRMKEELYEARAIISQRDEAEEDLRKIREDLKSIYVEQDQHQRLKAELAELQRRHSEELDRGAAVRKELEAADYKVANLKEELGKLEPRAEQLRTEERRLRAVVASLEGEHQKLEQLVQSWRQQASDAQSEMQRIKEQRDDLDKEVKVLRHAVAELNGEQAGLEKVVKRLRHDAGKETDRLADLWKPVFTTRSRMDCISDAEDDSLDATQDYLQRLGLTFPDRVLKAFHTSMKVADVSPLVVLAGISGTGKSELPLRYAEGMGMHFLNLAVQPRWDSPQDMFGFFNYMEGRYRATELARALVQMDRFYDQGDRGWQYPGDWPENSLRDQMLIVLLDEMNLARVEYYFSEFLSRLEIRRGIKSLGDSLSRRKAEVPLEVGGAGGADSILYLFADTNVLFVGTMNEDETTQALSDKVVDRANVLRFGKPSSFPEKRKIEKPSPPARYMPFSNWQKWVKTDNDLVGTASEQVNGWIAELNDIMATIRRPFAHRTHLAMRTYVANYPHSNSDRVAREHSIVDQVEQKVLPKFRGLDLHEPSVRDAMDRLIRFLRDRGDGHLAAAVGEARSGADHMFMWQGIDRSQEFDH